MSETLSGDDLLLIEDGPPGDEQTGPCWRILIVDDEQDVHRATVFALSGLTICDRRLEFLHAYSGAEAEHLLAHEEDIALILLDVVMERASAGLDLVRVIREKLSLKEARIVLRTGQPGYAPEIETIQNYDINDYKTKAELSRTRLYATVATALRSYQQICLLNEYAYCDSLCRVPNRNRFLECVQHCLEDEAFREQVVALVDIDDFAETNDALGHRHGDLLLQSVAARLGEALGPATVLARIGGDVFGLLGVEAVVEPGRLNGLFSQPFRVVDDEMQVSATVGLLRLRDYEGSASEVLQDANIALKRAKSKRRGGFAYFTEEMGVAIRERVRLLRNLRTAFESEDRLFLVYQPQVLLESGRAYGAEALLRWRTEDGRFVAPDLFIPLTEYSGLIVPIGEWVMRCACHQQKMLAARGFPDFQIAVNVSLAQFRHPDFIDMTRRTLMETGVDPSRLELEITESMAVEDLVVATIQKIKALGVSVAIDDFGTGYSSLSHLRRLPVDRLKIDRTFIAELTQSPHGDYIASLVVDLGRKFKLRVIAEGIETPDQVEVLRRLGCHEGQGYHYARPMPAQELLAWLDSQRDADAALQSAIN